MGVYIKGMDMPKCCDSCEFYDIVLSEKPFCVLTMKSGGAGGFNHRKERMIDCPLVEVKVPHGRLIDVDAIIKEHGFEMFDHSIEVDAEYIENEPTIIEAEEKDDG